MSLARPVTVPARRAQVAAAVAALVVAVLAVWLTLRLISAGSDADDARARQQAHTAAATALTTLAAAVKDPVAVAAATPDDLTTLSALASAPVKLLGDAGASAGAATLTAANTALLDALRTQPVDQQPSDPQAADQKAGAVRDYATRVATLLTAEQGLATAAAQQVKDATSTRASSFRYLAVLLILAAAAAVAWFAGLIPVRAQARVQPQTPVRAHQRPTAARVFDQFDGPPVLTSSQPVTGGWNLAGPASPAGPAGPPRTSRARLAVTTSAHPGITLDAAVHGGVVIYAGSVIGPEHRGGKNFAPREDAYSWAPGQDPSVIVVAVADGVGSARNSHAAALLAAESAVSQLRTAGGADVATWFEQPQLWRDQAQRLMAAVADQLHPGKVDQRAAMIELATGSSTSGQRRTDPATTLVIALGLISGDGVRVVWASVGDSQVSVLAPGATQISWSQAEGDAPSGTRALPRDAARVVSSQYFLPPGHGFLLTTDGCEKVLSLDAGAVPLLHEMIRTPGDTGRLLELLQRTVPGAGDDRTLVLIAPSSST